MAKTDTEWLALMDEWRVPVHLRNGLMNYLAHHRPTGDFLQAVLTNRLMEAVSRADDDSLAGILPLMRFLYNEAPAISYGSPERVDTWLNQI